MSPIPSFVAPNTPMTQCQFSKNRLYPQSGHSQCALHTIGHSGELLPCSWVPHPSQSRISGLDPHSDVLAIQQPQNHIPKTTTTIDRCTPPTQGYSLGILAQSDQYIS